MRVYVHKKGSWTKCGSLIRRIVTPSRTSGNLSQRASSRGRGCGNSPLTHARSHVSTHALVNSREWIPRGGAGRYIYAQGRGKERERNRERERQSTNRDTHGLASKKKKSRRHDKSPLRFETRSTCTGWPTWWL